MLKLASKYFSIALCIFAVLYGLIQIAEVLDNKIPEPTANSQVDSLKNIIKINNIILKRNEVIIDSLYNHKSQITNKYETTIENYSNPTIVSDDSISNFISKELLDWK